ncbi:unnamed protein product [Camellia sinensis]
MKEKMKRQSNLRHSNFWRSHQKFLEDNHVLRCSCFKPLASVLLIDFWKLFSIEVNDTCVVEQGVVACVASPLATKSLLRRGLGFHSWEWNRRQDWGACKHKLRYGGRLERIQEHLNVEFTCLGGKPREGTRGLHEFLKVVEIVITVVSRHPYYMRRWDLNDPIGEGNDAARERAKQLKTKLPLGTELVNFDCKIVN